MGIDEVGIDKVGIDEVGRYRLNNAQNVAFNSVLKILALF